MYNLIYPILNIFEFTFIYKLVVLFVNKPAKNRKIEIISFILFYIENSLNYIFINIPFFTLISTVLILFLFTYNYNISMTLRYSCTVFITCIIVLAEFISYKVYSTDLGGALKKNNHIIIKEILIYLLILLCIYYIIKFITCIKSKIAINLYIILISTLCIIFSILISIEDKISGSNIAFSAIIMLCIVAVSIYVYVRLIEYHNENFKIGIIEKQNKYYKQQLLTINRLSKTSKSVKHDYKNHMSVIKSLLDNENFDELKKYVNNICNKISEIEKINYTENIVINSILSFKIDEIKESCIKFDFNIKIPKDLNINSVDITIVLSNLLDNAIEACKRDSKTLNKYINLDLIFKDNLLILKCKNSFDGLINEKGRNIITRKDNKVDCGIGIFNIENVVKKYNGLMEILYDENNFNVDISLIMPN